MLLFKVLHTFWKGTCWILWVNHKVTAGSWWLRLRQSTAYHALVALWCLFTHMLHSWVALVITVCVPAAVLCYHTLTQWARLEGTTVGHQAQPPCSGWVIGHHIVQDCIQMVLKEGSTILLWKNYLAHIKVLLNVSWPTFPCAECPASSMYLSFLNHDLRSWSQHLCCLGQGCLLTISNECLKKAFQRLLSPNSEEILMTLYFIILGII